MLRRASFGDDFARECHIRGAFWRQKMALMAFILLLLAGTAAPSDSYDAIDGAHTYFLLSRSFTCHTFGGGADNIGDASALPPIS